jgi:transposase
MDKRFDIYWGIDVSKEWLDIDVGSEVIRIAQNEKAIKEVMKQHKIENSQSLLATLESTGGYERLAIRCLSEAGVVVHVAHPNKVKSFARARGRLAKTDQIDAVILKEYGRFIKPDEIKPLPTALESELELLGSRLDQLKEMHHQERCRLGIACGEGVKKSITNMIKLLKEEMEILEESILELINKDECLKEKYNILCSMKGVGPVLAMKLITDLPELGEANEKEIAALVGVAPITHDSGQKKGKAMTKYGRHGVRKTLYMGALTASRHNPRFQSFYTKLIEAGKPPKVALVAVMRKMIVTLNAMVQSKKHFYA